MTFDEALEQAVLGERVRAVNMMAGTYIDYQFNGWRINTASGSSSGYTFKDIDKVSEWEIAPEPAKEGWHGGWTYEPTPKVPSSLTPPIAVPAKRRGRKAWQPPAEINDIEDEPAETKTDKANPWAGLTDEAKPASGWAVFNTKE